MPFEKGQSGNEDTQFKPGQSGNPDGRPKKIYTLIKETGYSKDDLRTALNEMAWHTDAELQALYKDKNTPMIVKVIARALNKAATAGDFNKINQILEYALGKPRQEIEGKMNIEYIEVGYGDDEEDE